MWKATLGMLVVVLTLACVGRAAASADTSRHGTQCGGGGHGAADNAVPTPPDDQDCDYVKDDVDNCPPSAANDFSTRNPDQTDTDHDGAGDKCDPDDDNDLVADAEDNCRTFVNPGQEDSNGDGIGDACANVDTDLDGVIDPQDNCPRRANADQVDSDRDGLGDRCDSDDDDDYVADNAPDNCPLTPNQNQADGDGDGVGTSCDPDESPFGPPTPEGPGAGAPPPPAAASVDRTRPTLRLTIARRQAFDELGGGLVASIRCSEACRITAELRLGAKQARRLRLTRVRTVASGSAMLAAAGRTYAFLRFDRRAKRKLWRTRRTTVQLQVAAVDAAGNRRVLTRKLTLHR